MNRPSSGVAYAPHRREARSSRIGQAVRRAREHSAVRGYRAAAAAIGRIPTRLSLPVGKALLVGSYFAWPTKRRIILANASHVLQLPASDRRVRHLARRIYATYAQFIIELMRLPRLPASEPARLVRGAANQGDESFFALFERYRAEGRGMIVVSAHIGSIDMMAGSMAYRGLPCYGVADDSAYPELFEAINEQRRRWGIQVIPWKNLRRTFKALRDGGIVGLVVDWGYRAEDVPVQLFGEWATLPAGPVMLAARTNAPIVPVVCRRMPDGFYEARHYEPIEVANDSPAETLRVTRLIATAVEDMIATAPEQWYSFKPIWPDTDAEKQKLADRAAQMESNAASDGWNPSERRGQTASRAAGARAGGGDT